MSRRWKAGNNEQLTPDELLELRRRLAAMPSYELENFYRATHNACRYEIHGRVPSPSIIQQLVTAWKVLRKLR